MFKSEMRGGMKTDVRIQLVTGFVVGQSCLTHCGTWHLTV